MKSANFEILRKRWPALPELGGFVEPYARADPCFKRTETSPGGPLQ